MHSLTALIRCSIKFVAVRLLLEMEEIDVGGENVAGDTAADIGREALAELSEGRKEIERGRKVKDAEEILRLLGERAVG